MSQNTLEFSIYSVFNKANVRVNFVIWRILKTPIGNSKVLPMSKIPLKFDGMR